jgi:hypothetical protein
MPIPPGGSEDAAGKERRRFERHNRRLVVTFTLEGQEWTAHTLDVSRTGALFQSDQAPSVGTRLLLNLSDRKNPEVSLYLKAAVVRSTMDDKDGPQFAVEFGDAIARDPKRLRLFLDRVLGISTGLIRVIGGEGGVEKAYAFNFESVHREGEERVKALHASLFSSLDEMEEADAILAGFGKTPVADVLETRRHSSSPTEDTETPPPAAASSEPMESVPNGAPQADAVGANEPPAAPDEERLKEMLSADRPNTAELEIPQKKSIFKRLFGSGKKTKKTADKTSKGETLIQTQRLPTIVANNANLPIVYRIGTTRFNATATRLYCAGMKCRTSQILPQLYAGLTIFIPLAGAKRISQIELVGDVTRVRPDEENSDTAGIFEVRLSMRTDKTHLELYRVLLDKMTES